MGEGALAQVRFRVIAAGDPKLRIASIDGRDAMNRKVPVGQEAKAPTVAPSRTQLAAGRPNPFQQSVTFPFSLSREGHVELALYSVDGRLVRTLVSETRAPGEYEVAWDGRDDAGHVVVAGVYFARLDSPRGSFTRTIVHVK